MIYSTHDNRNPSSVEGTKDDVCLPADIPDSRWRDIDDDEVADPVGRR